MRYKTQLQTEAFEIWSPLGGTVLSLLQGGEITFDSNKIYQKREW